MDIMAFMEAMGTSEIAIVAAFFIGLMTAISPCPLASNITAISYVSKRIKSHRNTLLVGTLYTLGRALTYVGIASAIVYIGLSSQQVSLAIQSYGEKFLGPLFILVGLIMLEIIKLNFIKTKGDKLEKIKKSLGEKGYAGSFLLGVVLAFAFCPFSAVLFFGMLIPLALSAGDGILIPAVFGISTGLPVIILSVVLVYSVKKLGEIMNKIQTFEKWMRRIVGIIFLVMGIYYLSLIFI